MRQAGFDIAHLGTGYLDLLRVLVVTQIPLGATRLAAVQERLRPSGGHLPRSSGIVLGVSPRAGSPIGTLARQRGNHIRPELRG